ncbi:MAG: hypothetical protein HQK51_06745 [Oligoflexia bacterium]|nr:hypothetical protein [Oligoflexia bacterium]
MRIMNFIMVFRKYFNKNKSYHLDTTSGIALLQVLAVSAAISVMVVASIEFSKYSSLQRKSIRARQTLEDWVSELQMIFDDGSICKSNLQGTSITTATVKTAIVATSGSVSTIINFNPASNTMYDDKVSARIEEYYVGGTPTPSLYNSQNIFDFNHYQKKELKVVFVPAINRDGKWTKISSKTNDFTDRYSARIYAYVDNGNNQIKYCHGINSSEEITSMNCLYAGGQYDGMFSPPRCVFNFNLSNIPNVDLSYAPPAPWTTTTITGVPATIQGQLQNLYTRKKTYNTDITQMGTPLAETKYYLCEMAKSKWGGDPAYKTGHPNIACLCASTGCSACSCN